MTERDLIDELVQGFPRAPEQLNAVHQADAEILRMGDDLWAVTVDEFSPEEDRFFQADPWLIGWNVSVATLSDLLAVGAAPRFFLPTVSLPTGTSGGFLSELRRGIRDALAAAGCFLVGGDVGQADPWRLACTALGPLPSRRPVTRELPPGTHTLWVSGPLGGANMAAATGTPPPPFPLRMEVAELVRAHAGACIDTSGGFADGVWNLWQNSPGARLEVALAALPLAPEVSALASSAFLAVEGLGEAHPPQSETMEAEAWEIPPEAVLLGGAGEYELLFSLPESAPETVERELVRLGCRRVGRVEREEPSGGPGSIRFLRADGRMVEMAQGPPCPRSAGSPEAHVREVVAMARALFGRGSP